MRYLRESLTAKEEQILLCRVQEGRGQAELAAILPSYIGQATGAEDRVPPQEKAWSSQDG